MAKCSPTAYDNVLYPSHTHSQTHPDRLSTIATLFGMKPSPVEHCRVLELGCGNGGNLIPMAFGLPQSEFVGIDLAARPIAQGVTAIKALGLGNISLRERSILEVSSDLGPFDYIIAHGVYSWVPLEVRDKILAICRSHLAPQGVAFVSYNAYPGSHLREMVREMMLFHVHGFEDPQERVKQAIALTKFLAESQEDPDIYRRYLKEALEEVLEHDDGHLYHDELAEINRPVYFHQFFHHARQQGLQYLGEADYFEMQDHMFKPEVSQALQQLSANRMAREQYLDFLKCRRFRQTLLCHADVPLDLSPKPSLLTRFYVSSAARPVSEEPNLSSTSIEKFQGKRSASMETDFPLAKAAVLILGEVWPQVLHFPELLARVRVRLGIHSTPGQELVDQEALALCEILLKTYGTGLLDLHLYAPRYASEVSQRPTASPLARWQIQQGGVVANLCHTSVVVEDELGRHLLSLLDGARDRSALLEAMLEFAASRSATPADNQSVPDPAHARKILGEQLDRNLQKLARMALLVA